MSWTHFRDEHPRARKPYICCGCGTRIEIGEIHLYRVGAWQGDGLTTSRWHPECERFAFSDPSEPIYESPPGCFSRKEAMEHYSWEMAQSQPQMPPF